MLGFQKKKKKDLFLLLISELQPQAQRNVPVVSVRPFPQAQKMKGFGANLEYYWDCPHSAQTAAFHLSSQVTPRKLPGVGLGVEKALFPEGGQPREAVTALVGGFR